MHLVSRKQKKLTVLPAPAWGREQLSAGEELLFSRATESLPGTRGGLGDERFHQEGDQSREAPAACLTPTPPQPQRPSLRASAPGCSLSRRTEFQDHREFSFKSKDPDASFRSHFHAQSLARPGRGSISLSRGQGGWGGAWGSGGSAAAPPAMGRSSLEELSMCFHGAWRCRFWARSEPSACLVFSELLLPVGMEVKTPVLMPVTIHTLQVAAWGSGSQAVEMV